MATINIGLQPEELKGSLSILDKVLSDEFLLYVQTRKYHWNVTGINFNDLHKMFQAQYEELDETIDEIAERSRSLGGLSMGTLTQYIATSRLQESPSETPGSIEMIHNLLTSNETIIRELRKDVEDCQEKYNDAGTADFLTGVMEKHEKTAWMLRTLLDK